MRAELPDCADGLETVASAQLIVDQDQAEALARQFGGSMRQIDGGFDGANPEAAQHDGGERGHVGGRVGDQRREVDGLL